MADSVFSNRLFMGRKFLVMASTNANWDRFSSMLPTDPEGQVRVFSTLASAVSACSANNDDVIYVAPGHTESIIAAAGIAASKAGINIVGLGTGTARPTFTFSTVVGASWDITAANNYMENIIFDMTGVDAITAGLNVQAANATFTKCEFVTATATNQTVLAILTNASGTGLLVQNCYFRGANAAGTTAAIRIVGGNDHLIQNNVFIGAYTSTVGAIQGLTTDCDRSVVRDNFIWNLTAASTKAMVFTTNSTVIISGNRMQIYSGSRPFTAAGSSWNGGNYFSAVKGSSILIGHQQYAVGSVG